MSNPSPDDEIADAHSYFVPMVDMLAGVVFILVILLASVTLVSRSDFAATSEMSSELAKITAELEAARALDSAVLEPRRNADAALKLLLSRLEESLARRGVKSEGDAARGRLVVPVSALFQPGSVRVTGTGQRVSEALAEALVEELPCLSPGSPEAGADCAAYPPARLSRTIVTVQPTPSSGPTGPRDNAKALEVLSTLVRARPALLSLRATDEGDLFIYRGSADVSAPVAVPERRGGSNPATDADSSSRGDVAAVAAEGLELIFQMEIPPVPSPG